VPRRIVKEHGDRVLRDELGLKNWVQNPATRRSQYFEWCDLCVRRFESLSGEDGIDDEAVVKGIAACVDVDETFEHFVREREDAEMLLENEPWDRIVRIGAGQIYYEYLAAKEKEEWP
jgi:hypothetical protein